MVLILSLEKHRVPSLQVATLKTDNKRRQQQNSIKAQSFVHMGLIMGLGSKNYILTNGLKNFSWSRYFFFILVICESHIDIAMCVGAPKDKLYFTSGLTCIKCQKDLPKTTEKVWGRKRTECAFPTTLPSLETPVQPSISLLLSSP